MDTLTYKVGNGLYVNLTNRCTMNCTFCIRSHHDGVGDAETLWLSREHTKEELLEDIVKHDLPSFHEIVFCGFGEPTERLYDMLWICRELKKLKNAPQTRVDTNGHASLLEGKDVSPLFCGVLDTVSVSLNAPTAEEYTALCRPESGEAAFYAMLDFTKKVKQYVPNTYMSVLDILPSAKLAACKALCDQIGVALRVRHFT